MRRGHPLRWVVMALAVLLVAGSLGARWRTADPGAPSEVRVNDAMVAETPLGFAAAVYLTLHQHGGDDRLLGATSPVAERTSLHLMEPLPGGGLMLPIDAIELPAGASIALEPFGSHIMLDELVEPLVAGTEIVLILRFDRSDEVEVTVEVIDLDRLADLGQSGGNDR